MYIAIRCRAAFAAGAIAATLHDVLVTLAFISLTGYDLSLNVVAARLTIIALPGRPTSCHNLVVECHHPR